EERQLLPQEDILGSQGAAGMCRKESQANQVAGDQKPVRKQCGTAPEINEPDIERPGSHVTEHDWNQIQLGQSYCGSQPFIGKRIPVRFDRAVLPEIVFAEVLSPFTPIFSIASQRGPVGSRYVLWNSLLLGRRFLNLLHLKTLDSLP